MAQQQPLSFTDNQLLLDACTAFASSTRIFHAEPVSAQRFQGPSVDAAIRFKIDGTEFTMPVHFARALPYGIVFPEQHQYVTDQQKRPPRSPLLLASYIGPIHARKLIEMGRPFLDAAGNVFLREPEATVMVIGQPKPAIASAKNSARATTRKGLQVMFALATQPHIVNAPYRTIADVSAVALSTVNQVVDDLMERGLLATRRGGERLIPDWQRYVKEWVSLYPSRLRAKLPSARFASTAPEWWREFNFETIHGLLGGEAAADILTGSLRPAQVTIYSQASPSREFMLKARLHPDAAGDVEVVQAFWPENYAQGWPKGMAQLVHPLLIYADLLASGDGRNLEIAQNIHEQYLSAPIP